MTRRVIHQARAACPSAAVQHRPGDARGLGGLGEDRDLDRAAGEDAALPFGGVIAMRADSRRSPWRLSLSGAACRRWHARAGSGRTRRRSRVPRDIVKRSSESDGFTPLFAHFCRVEIATIVGAAKHAEVIARAEATMMSMRPVESDAPKSHPVQSAHLTGIAEAKGVTKVIYGRNANCVDFATLFSVTRVTDRT